MSAAFNQCYENGFACPICFRFANYQLRPCVGEHAMCCSCYQRIQKCPICRAARLQNEPYILEELHSERNSPCLDVCMYTAQEISAQYHKTGHELSMGNYVINFSRSCFWHAPMNEVVQHLIEHHQESFTFGYSRSFTQLEAQPTSDNPIRIHIFNLSQEIFMASWFYYGGEIIFTTIPIMTVRSRYNGYDIKLTVDFDDMDNEDNSIDTYTFGPSNSQIQGLLVKGCVKEYRVDILQQYMN